MTKPLLADKVAEVSGAGHGIRREIARALHRHGARVSLASELSSDITGSVLEVGGGRFM